MDKKINKYSTIVIFAAIAFNLSLPQANAGILDWALGEKAGNLPSKLIAFAGVGRETGINFLDTENKNNSSDTQFLQSNSVIAANGPGTTQVKFRKNENRAYIVPATAYSSTKDQTDHTPFITASGTHVREGVIAANFLPLGTVVKIPEIFGDKTFIVEDRMNSRYFYQIDVWFQTKTEAKEFGFKKVKIEIIS